MKKFPTSILAFVLFTAAFSGVGFASETTTQTSASTWTSTSLRDAIKKLPIGNIERGKIVNQQMFCASCHGEKGVAPTQNWPHLAGQRASYTAKLLLDYRDKRHITNQQGQLMHDIAIMLSPQQIADVSAYYAAQPAATNDMVSSAKTNINAEQLARKGDTSRLITPCASCHGAKGQGGNLEAPSLNGQNPLYFVKTMTDYKTGTRKNDVAHGMQNFAKKLSHEEIVALANYYAHFNKK